MNEKLENRNLLEVSEANTVNTFNTFEYVNKLMDKNLLVMKEQNGHDRGLSADDLTKEEAECYLNRYFDV